MTLRAPMLPSPPSEPSLSTARHDAAKRLPRSLAAKLRAAEAAWPGVIVSHDEALAYIAARTGEGLAPALNEARVIELYLVCACARGDAHALEHFETRYLPHVDRAMKRLKASPADVADVRAELRKRFFFPEGDAAPLIREYAGRGELSAWVRAIAVRTLLNLRRREEKSVTLDERLLEIASPAASPDVAYERSLYGAELTAAIRSALDALPARDRNLLRQHHLDGLGVEALGRMYRVHHATAARWLVRARASVFECVRERLRERLRLSPSECESVLRAAGSQLDVSISRVLRDTRA